MVKLSAHQHLGNRRSSVFSETRMTSLCSSLVTNNRRVSFVYSEQRSVGEDVSKDASPRQGVVTFTSPRTLRRSSAQTARTGRFWWMFFKSVPGALAQMVLRTCKPKKDLPPRTINGHTTYSQSLASRLCYFGCPAKPCLSPIPPTPGSP